MNKANQRLQNNFNHCLSELTYLLDETYCSDYYTPEEMEVLCSLYTQIKIWKVLSENCIRKEYTTLVPGLKNANSIEESCQNCIYYDGQHGCKKFPSDLSNTDERKTCPAHSPGLSEEMKRYIRFTEVIARPSFKSISLSAPYMPRD